MGWLLRPALFRALGTRLIVQSSVPKSASQHLRTALEQALQPAGSFIHPRVALGFGHNFYDRCKIPPWPGGGRVFRFYGHTPLSEYNFRILRDVDPNFIAVVSIRPLPDVVVSYADHIERHGHGPLDMRVPDSVEGFRFYSELNADAKFDYIIQFIVPWLVQFLSSWLNFEPKQRVLFVKFEDIAADIRGVLNDVARHLQNNNFPLRLNSVFEEPTAVNFNKGVSGRGAALLKQAHLDQIRNLSSWLRRYPGGNEIYTYLNGFGADPGATLTTAYIDGVTARQGSTS